MIQKILFTIILFCLISISSPVLAEQKPYINLVGLTIEESVLIVNFETINFYTKEGKFFPLFYFDDYSDLNSSMVFLGESNLILPTSLLPVDSQKICTFVIKANLEIVDNQETCLFLR